MSLARRSYALSWVVPFLSGCLPSSLCTYYSTLLVVCQEFFETFFKFFWSERNLSFSFNAPCSLTSPNAITYFGLMLPISWLCKGEIVLLTFVNCYQALRPRGLFPLTLHSYYSTVSRICQGFWQKKFCFSRYLLDPTPFTFRDWFPSPHCDNSIPHQKQKVNSFRKIKL